MRQPHRFGPLVTWLARFPLPVLAVASVASALYYVLQKKLHYSDRVAQEWFRVFYPKEAALYDQQTPVRIDPQEFSDPANSLRPQLHTEKSAAAPLTQQFTTVNQGDSPPGSPPPDGSAGKDPQEKPGEEVDWTPLLHSMMSQAQLALRTKDLRAAEILLKEVVRRGSSSNDKEALRLALEAFATLLSKIVVPFKTAEEANSFDQLRRETCLKLANIALAEGDMLSALRYLTDRANFLQIRKPTEAARAYSEIVELAELASRRFRRKNDWRGMAISLSWKAHVLTMVGHTEAAIATYRQIAILYEQLKDFIAAEVNYRKMAHLLLQMGRHLEAAHVCYRIDTIGLINLGTNNLAGVNLLKDAADNQRDDRKGDLYREAGFLTHRLVKENPSSLPISRLSRALKFYNLAVDSYDAYERDVRGQLSERAREAWETRRDYVLKLKAQAHLDFAQLLTPPYSLDVYKHIEAAYAIFESLNDAQGKRAVLDFIEKFPKPS